MGNGTAESRSHWVTYALGTTATAVVGTKGVGTVTKTGAATTKAAVQKSVKATQNTLQALRTLELPQLLPYTPRLELALPDSVPVKVVDGNKLKEQLMLMAKRNDAEGTDQFLLPTEGKVGTFKELAKQGTAFDNITPHHIPSAAKIGQVTLS